MSVSLTGVNGVAPLNARAFRQFIPAEDYFVMETNKLKVTTAHSCCFTENARSESLGTCIPCSPPPSLLALILMVLDTLLTKFLVLSGLCSGLCCGRDGEAARGNSFSG